MILIEVHILYISIRSIFFFSANFLLENNTKNKREPSFILFARPNILFHPFTRLKRLKCMIKIYRKRLHTASNEAPR